MAPAPAPPTRCRRRFPTKPPAAAAAAPATTATPPPAAFHAVGARNPGSVSYSSLHNHADEFGSGAITHAGALAEAPAIIASFMYAARGVTRPSIVIIILRLRHRHPRDALGRKRHLGPRP